MSGLRVISGKARGRRLRPVPGDLTRPITDRAKESLFNILGSDIEGAAVLDMFAGTGSVGIEALSRGAARARFIDQQRQAIDTIRFNLASTGLEASAQVLRQDAFAALERDADCRFDYVFIAPPQYKELWKRAVSALDRRTDWLSEDAWVIVQIHPVEYQSLKLQKLIEFDQRRYGSVLFVFYERRLLEDWSKKSMKTSDYIELEEKFGAHNYHPLDVVIARGEGVWVYDVDGNRYLDCLSAYSALNQGHVHPRILNALINQAQKVTLTSRAFRNDQLPLLYQELSEMTGFEMALPMNSGAEAVETALKLARKWAYQVKDVPRHQAEIITFENNFHGRTISIISFSSEPKYRDDFGPFTPGFISVPYGDSAAVERAITPNTAAISVEPIQGEAGVIVPPDGFLRELRRIADRHNVLLIADEIQTGLGRTGKMFACEHENVRPDMMVIGKALSGGFYPVSAVLADRSLMGLFEPGEHGSTFGGNPLAAAVAREALAVLRDENLAENAARLGEYFLEQLAEIPSPHVKEVRGKGLLIGVELKPEAGGARRFCEALKDQGILVKETHHHVIRFAPPLIIDQPTIDWALPRIREVLLSR